MEDSAGYCTVKIMPHMMWAVPSLRKNHGQAKSRTKENKEKQKLIQECNSKIV